MKNQNSLKVLLLLSILTMMTACSKPNSSGDNDFSSTSNDSASTYVDCSQGSGYSNYMSVNIRSVTIDNVNRGDLMRLKFDSLNSNFANGGYIQIYRWQSSSTAPKYLDPTPLSFRAEAISSGALMTNFATSLNWSNLAYARVNQNAATVAELIEKVRFTVNTKDTAAAYQVLKVVLYDASNNVVDQADLLMPKFAAHPTNYAIEPNGRARPTALQNLHPFRSLANQGFTAAQIRSHSNSFCF